MKKFKMKKLIVGFCAILLSCSIFSISSISNNSNHISFASPVSFLDNSGDGQSTELKIDSILKGSETIYFYPLTEDDDTSIKDLFAYYYGNSAVKGNDSTTTELIHSVGGGAVSSTVPGNGQFVSVVNLTNNIVIAMNYGYITSISASAKTHSLYSDNWFAADEPETIVMSIYLYNSSTDAYVSASYGDSTTQSTSYVDYSAKISSGLSSNYNSIALSFVSTFTKAYNSSGIASTTGKNAMYIKEPTITLTTSDTTPPSGYVSADTSWTNGTRTLTIISSDTDSSGNAGSGIQKVEVKEWDDEKQDWVWNTIKNYADSLTYEYDIDEDDGVTYDIYSNGTYYFRVTDNVGNYTETSYTESHIDTTKPTIEVSAASSLWTNMARTLTIASSDDLSGIKIAEYSTDKATWTGINDYANITNISYEIKSNGTTYFRVIDNAGNVSDIAEYTESNIDMTNPEIQVSADDNWTNVTPKTITILSSDGDSGIKMVQYSTDNKTWNEFNDTDLSEIFYIVSSNGTYYFRVTDNAGNITSIPYVESYIDITVPEIQVLAASSLWTNAARTIEISSSDDLSGIKKAEYSTDKATWTEIDDYTNITNISYSILSNGTTYFRVTDNAGNVSDIAEYTESNIDMVAPTISGIDLEAGTILNSKEIIFGESVVISSNHASGDIKSNDTFYYTSEYTDFEGKTNSLVVVTLTEMTAGELKFDNPQNGYYTFKFYAYDEAGNGECFYSLQIIVDDTLYSISSDLKNCTLEISSSSELNVTNLSEAYRGEKITLKFSQVETVNEIKFCELSINGVKVNANEIDFNESVYSYSFVVAGENIKIEILFMQYVTLSVTQSYVYDPDGFKGVKYTGYEGDDVEFVYYLADDSEKSNPLSEISDVGNYVVCYYISNDLYYALDEVQFEIIPKVVTVSNVITEYTYTGEVQNLQFDLSEEIQVDAQYSKDGTSANFEDAGTYTCVLSSVSDNYSLTLGTGKAVIDNIVIQPKKVTISDVATSYTYAGDALSLDVKFDTEDFTSSLSQNFSYGVLYFQGGQSVNFENAGIYTCVILSDSSNFLLVYGENTASEVQIEGVTIKPKTIEVSNLCYLYTYNGKVQNLSFDLSEDIDCSVAFTQENEVAEFKNAGTYGFVITSDSTNYVLKFSGESEEQEENAKTEDGTLVGEITISPYLIEVLLDENTLLYTYDGECHEAEILSSTKLEGFEDEISIDQIELKYYYGGSETTSVKNAGEYLIELELIGNDNYQVSSESAEFTLKILQREIVVTFNSQQITYGETLEDFSCEVSNTLGGENFAFEYNTCAFKYNEFDDSIVLAGTYTVSISSPSCDNAEISNYTFVFVSGEVVVNKKQITVTADGGQSKIYGNEDKVLTYQITDGSLVLGDSLYGSLSRVVGENVGYYQITIGTLGNDNYEIVLESSEFEITKRMAFVIVASSSKTYGESDPEFSISFSNSNILDDDKDLFLSALSREAGEDVGTYEISLGNQAFENYTIVLKTGKLVISKATITVCAVSSSKTFDSADPEFDFDATGFVLDDDKSVLTGALSREVGEDVGYYLITIGTLASSNYEIVFESAIFEILPLGIVVYADDVTKIYGESENLTYRVVGTENSLEITLVRTTGEDAGTYEIYGYECSSPNYEIEFVSGTLTIEKLGVSVVLSDASKVYGEEDGVFSFQIEGISEDDYQILLAREAGESVGEYTIFVESFESQNYYLLNEDETAIFSIEKADVYFEIEGKTATYSGSAIFIDEIESEFEISYVYTCSGNVVENPIDAGEYSVYAYFAGDENHNEFTSSAVTLKINKKLASITIKNTTFTYTGSEILPEYVVNENVSLSVVVEFDGGVTPIEVGEYNFSIVIYDNNYYSSYTGTLVIVEEFYSENETGDASISSSNVSYSGSGIGIYENCSSSLMSMFSVQSDNRKVVNAYSFSVSDSTQVGDVFVVSIKSVLGANVKIYAVGEDGDMVELDYVTGDGYYTLSLNDLSSDIIVTVSDLSFFYAKIALTIVTVLTAFVCVQIMKRRKKNKFFKNNSKFYQANKEELEKNKDIVSKMTSKKKNISASEFLGQVRKKD